MATATLGIVDYIIFALVLAISAGIGIFYKFTGGKQKTADEYLLGDRQMPWFPVMCSLIATFMSAITMLGTPAETYWNGTMFWYIVLAFVFMTPAVAHLFLPLFYRLRITSVYEYLELRFDAGVRIITTIVFIITMIFYLSIVLYGPALALNAVTGLSLWASIPVVGAVCIFYTTLGGMKAVLLTDAFQIMVMFAGAIAVVIQGSIDFGGFGKIIEINRAGGRIEFDNWDPSPFNRHTGFSLVLGGGLFWMSIYGFNQSEVQRQIATKSLRTAQIALYGNCIGLAVLNTLVVLEGLVLYAAFAGCDPVTSKRIAARDQLIPLYAMDFMSHNPGVAGLVVSAVFSGSLSTISSGVNGLAAVLVKDIVGKCLKKKSEKVTAKASKIIAFIMGIVCIGLAFACSQIGSSILSLAYSMIGMLAGPSAGIFLLGMLWPIANKWGAYAGLLCGLVLNLWLGCGKFFNKVTISTPKPNSIEQCIVENVTQLITTTVANVTTTTTTTTTALPKTEHLKFYETSYMYYAPFGIVVVNVIGIIVSIITGGFKTYKEVDPKLIVPLFDTMFCYLPKGVRNKLQFGLDHDNKKYDDDITFVVNGTIDSPPVYTMNSTSPHTHVNGSYDTPRSKNTSPPKLIGFNQFQGDTDFTKL